MLLLEGRAPNLSTQILHLLYRFWLHRNDLTTEDAENTERDRREMKNSDVDGIDIIPTYTYLNSKMGKTDSARVGNLFSIRLFFEITISCGKFTS